MTQRSKNGAAGCPRRPLSFSNLLDSGKLISAVDVLAMLVMLVLPWSTSAVGIFMVVWLIVLIPSIDFNVFSKILVRPPSLLPLVFLGVAVVGTFWSEGPWLARLHGINPVVKLAAIPFLLYHFERSRCSNWIFLPFLVSCSLLMLLSWVVLFAPQFKVTMTASDGVPVKNYIDQSQEFALCFFAIAPLALSLHQERRRLLAAASAMLMIAFLANMMFVVSARTALIYIPVLLLAFGYFHLGRRAFLILIIVSVLGGVVIWSASPYLRNRVEAVETEYRDYNERNTASSTGLRLEFWRKSLRFFVEAPFVGHGTGSTKFLFERDASGQGGATAEIIGNPHNQTLNVAVQWGLIGCLVLYLMWFAHLTLFLRPTNFASWVGLLVVLQNVVSSLFNSHLFDFHEGWMYVLGVGVAGGLTLRSKLNSARDLAKTR